MQLTSILQTRAASWKNLQRKTSIAENELDFWVYYGLQLGDTLRYIL